MTLPLLRLAATTLQVQRSSMRLQINFDGTWSRIAGYHQTDPTPYTAAGNPPIGASMVQRNVHRQILAAARPC